MSMLVNTEDRVLPGVVLPTTYYYSSGSAFYHILLLRSGHPSIHPWLFGALR